MTCATCSNGTGTATDPILMTVGDTNPPLAGYFENGDATATLPATRPNLTGATVKIRIRDSSGTAITFTAAGLTILDPVAATFSYAWTVGDTDAAGSLRVTFQVTFPSGRVETFPSGGRFILVKVAA